MKLGGSTVTPGMGVSNLFDERNFEEIRIEDSTLRYCEPAPDVNFFASLRVRFDFGEGAK